MFKVLVFSAFCLMGLHATAEPRTCPVNVIKKGQIKTIVDRRQTTFKHCLACEGDQCVFKEWPAEGQDFAAACKLLFCTPTKMPWNMFVSEDVAKEGGVFFSYGINKKGRVDFIELTELRGDVTEDMARELINDYFERRRYEPIVVDGKTYELVDLKDGTNYKINWKVDVY
jgi:hypothetical protein